MAKSSAKREIRDWIKSIIYALVIVVGVRAFMVDLFAVPTTSMERSVLAGDFLVVSKLHYGPRVPITPISFPFAHQYMMGNSIRSYWDGLQLPYLRIPGFSDVSRNDVIVFNYPWEPDHPVDQRTYFIKRCVAIPGDSITITNKDIFVNKQLLPDPDDLQFSYRLKTDSLELNEEFFKEYGITEGGRISTYGDWQLTMPRTVALQLDSMEFFSEVVELADPPKVFSDYVFPYDDRYPWNVDHYGPLYIPKAGDSVQITLENLPFYKRLLEDYEEQIVDWDEEHAFVSQEPDPWYTFEMDYYFVMGDNRHSSSDSRHWGFVPENHLVGKALFTVFSIDKNDTGTRWNRIFKSID